MNNNSNKCVHRVVIDDIRLYVNSVGISRERVENILQHNELRTSKTSARWLPRLFTPEKLTRLTLSQANPAILKAEHARFFFFF